MRKDEGRERIRLSTMHLAITPLSVVAVLCLVTVTTWGQSPPSSLSGQTTGRTITAIGYQLGGGGTIVDLKSSGLIASASGYAKVEAKPGITRVEARSEGLTSPLQLGAEFLTYVLWAVSPEGRAINLGEMLLDSDGRSTLKTTTQLATFSLFVTAEPYFAVRQPSEMMVLENAQRPNTKGRIFMVKDYKLLKRSQYEKLGNPLALSLDLKNVPLQMYEARNAVDIARSRSAERYAPDVFAKADGGLKMAESALARNSSKKEIIPLARQTAQFSEDARALSVERQETERIETERVEAAARAKAEAEATAAAQAAAAKQKTDEEARRQAELAAAREAQMKAEAEVAATKAKVESDALKAREEAAKAEVLRAQRAAEQLRAQLLEQFNRILETRDTPRGLVITMADVLFDTGKYNIRPGTREQLAKLSGIILTHPGLNLQVEGHTDSTGSDEFNQRLSQQRGDSVRDFLTSQGLPANGITSTGFGKAMPISDNDTGAGRQKNRRVEIIVSGEVIGAKIGN
jgi:outer membrane protein OmpA-like peptidoglycan-associated protein